MTDVRTTGGRIVNAIARAPRVIAGLLLLLLCVVLVVGIPVGTVYVVVHFIVRYW